MTTGFSGGFLEVMAREMQIVRQKEAIYPAIGRMTTWPNIAPGDTFHKPIGVRIPIQNYVRGSTFAPTTHSATDENLVVNTQKLGAITLEDYDVLQSSFDLAQKYGRDTGRDLEHVINGDFLADVVNATHSLDDSDLTGGAANDGFVLSTGNIFKMFSYAKRKLQANGLVHPDNLYAVISSPIEAILLELVANKNTQLGDKTGLNGHIGEYLGFQVYVNDAIAWSASLVLATQPANNDTVTLQVQGVNIVFTFVTTIGTTAGNVLIGGSAANARANLVLALSAGTGAVTQYVALSAANQLRLVNMVATSNSTTSAVDVTFRGGGFAKVSSSLSLSASDGWVANTQIAHPLFGQKENIDIVIQQKPKIEKKEIPNQLAVNLVHHTLYGIRSFTEGRDAMVDVKVRTNTAPFQ